MKKTVVLLKDHDFEKCIGEIIINVSKENEKYFIDKFCGIGNGFAIAPGYIVKSVDPKNPNIITDVELLEVSICKIK